MRIRYIVTYDITDARRLRRVHRTMRGYGEALQYSVFSCDLSPAERVLLVEALTPLINHREDQCCSSTSVLLMAGAAKASKAWDVRMIKAGWNGAL